MVWEQIGADGESRALDGRTKFGRTNWDSSPANLVQQAYEEALDGAWYLKRAAQLMGPGPDGQLRVYISGPYSDDDPEQLDANIEQAREAAGAILTRGHHPFCPHSMFANFDERFPHISEREFLLADLAFLPFCHVLLQLPGWEDSAGSLIELEDAERLGLLVLDEVDELPNLTARRLARL